MPNSQQRLSLPPRGLLYILEDEPDLIPDISKEYIWDKSKAGNLAKTLVCLQALWFCVQCILRLAQGLTISLLELNVFCHAICTLLVYLLWWDKPMDIEEPTALRGKMVREMCALMCMRSFSKDGQEGFTELPYGVRYGNKDDRSIAETSVSVVEDITIGKGEIIWICLCILLGFPVLAASAAAACCIGIYKHVVQYVTVKHPLGERELVACRLKWTVPISMDGQVENTDNDASHPVNLNYPGDAQESEDEMTTSSPSSTLAVGVDDGLRASRNKTAQCLKSHPQDSSISTSHIDGFSLALGEWRLEWDQEKPDEPIHWFFPWQPKPDLTPTSINLSATDVARWRLCASALQRYCPQPRWLHNQSGYSHQDFPAYRSVCDRSPDWPSSEHLVSTGDGRNSKAGILVGFSFAGLVYGGFHLLAWDAPFPSQLERTLWRGSGILLASSGIALIAVPTALPWFFF